MERRLELGLWQAMDAANEDVSPMHAARAVCRVSRARESALNAELLLLLHHPLLRSTDPVCSVGWRMFKSTLPNGLHFACESMSTADCSAMVDQVVAALGSTTKTRVEAAVYTIETLV